MTYTFTTEDVEHDLLIAALASFMAEEARSHFTLRVNETADRYSDTHDVSSFDARYAAQTVQRMMLQMRTQFSGYPISGCYEAIAALRTERARQIERAL